MKVSNYVTLKMTVKDREEQRHKHEFKGCVVFIGLNEKKEVVSDENNTQKYWGGEFLVIPKGKSR